MLNKTETDAIAVVASMSAHHGSYTHLCENGGAPFLSHVVVGHELYDYRPPPEDFPAE